MKKKKKEAQLEVLLWLREISEAYFKNMRLKKGKTREMNCTELFWSLLLCVWLRW